MDSLCKVSCRWHFLFQLWLFCLCVLLWNEEEHNNQLAFLDVLLTNNGTNNTQVYRKKTHTNQVLNFNSNHPTQHKIICIRTLFNRIDTHCNTEQAKQTERRYLYSTFMKNNYPKNFINKVLTSVRNQRQINKSNEQPEQPKTTITLPYINSTSETRHILRN